MPKPCPCLLVTDCGKPLGDLLDSTERAYGVQAVTGNSEVIHMPHALTGNWPVARNFCELTARCTSCKLNELHGFRIQAGPYVIGFQGLYLQALR